MMNTRACTALGRHRWHATPRRAARFSAAVAAITCALAPALAGPDATFTELPLPSLLGAAAERWEPTWLSADGGVVIGSSQTLAGAGRGFRLPRRGPDAGTPVVWSAPSGFRRFSTLGASGDGGLVLGVCLGLTGSPTIQPLNGASAWTAPAGVVRLSAPAGFDDAVGVWASDGGSGPGGRVVAGSVRRFLPFSERAALWPQNGAGAPEILGAPAGSTSCEAIWISPDGQTVVGNAEITGLGVRAVRWSAGLPTVIGGLPTWAAGCRAVSVNQDGSVIACVVSEPSGGQEQVPPAAIFRWTLATGLVEIVPRSQRPAGERVLISGDGGVFAVTGDLNDLSAPPRPLRWTSPNGLIDIAAESASGGAGSGAGATAGVLSRDGRTIVGTALRSPSGTPGGPAGSSDWYIWTDAGGVRSLIEVVADLGVLPAGWDALTATAVNDDGTVLAGEGRRRLGDGTWEWRPVVVTLPPLCAGDFDGSRVVNSDDLFAYLRAFFDGLPRADLDGGGVIDGDDLLIFVERWIAGC